MIFFATLMGSSLLFWWVLLVASKRITLLQKSKINSNAFPPKTYRNKHQQKNNQKNSTTQQKSFSTFKCIPGTQMGAPCYWSEFFFLFWGVDLQKQRSIRVPAVRTFPSPKIWRVSNPNFLHPETPRFTMQNRGAGLKVSSWWRILAEAWKTKFISINKWNSLKTQPSRCLPKNGTHFSMFSLGVFFFWKKNILCWLGRGSGVFCFVRKV